MKFQDYYETLGVQRGATDEDVKKAYRKLAMKWHPDRHKGKAAKDAEKRFQAISEAYEVLSDPEKRKKYDRFGEHWQQGEDFTPPPEAGRGGWRTMSPEEFESVFGGRGFSDFFTTFFGDDMAGRFRGRGRGARRAARQQGADVRAILEVPVSFIHRGGERSFDLETEAPCRVCGGAGRIEDDHICPACGGLGRTRGRRTVTVKIPAGVRPGQVLRLRGLGEPGDDGVGPGDLHLTVALAGDEIFRIDGDDLLAELPLHPWEAALGARVPVATPSGEVTLTIPAGTRAGARLRLRGQGLPAAGGGHGDLLVETRIVLPPDLSARQTQLLQELAATRPEPPRGGARGGGGGGGGGS